MMGVQTVRHMQHSTASANTWLYREATPASPGVGGRLAARAYQLSEESGILRQVSTGWLATWLGTQRCGHAVFAEGEGTGRRRGCPACAAHAGSRAMTAVVAACWVCEDEAVERATIKSASPAGGTTGL
jgi:hypothetical protein